MAGSYLHSSSRPNWGIALKLVTIVDGILSLEMRVELGSFNGASLSE